MKIVIASRNRGKIEEIKRLLSSTDHTFLSLHDLNSDMDVIEDGLTFEQNALKKAVTVSGETGFPAISDDSGLEVNALGGAPGIHTARFGREGMSDRERYLFLLEKMKAVPISERKARFVCIAAFADDRTDKSETFRGECEGEILSSERGGSGFGYDPVFYLPDFGKTFAELEPDIKNRMSHRAAAFKKVSGFLNNFCVTRQLEIIFKSFY